MYLTWPSHYFIIFLTLACTVTATLNNYYSEKLYFKPRESNSLLAQLNFNFIEHLSGNDIIKFSPVLHSLLKRCHVDTLEFSIARGLWYNKYYGLPPELGAAPGVHVIARFNASTKNYVVKSKWKTLVQQLNGLFCSSFEIISQTMSASLQMSEGASSNQIVYYGAFTGDSICTENVDSIRKLLPCHRTGLCQLLNNVETLYKSLYFSMGFTATLQSNTWSVNVQANILKQIKSKRVSVYQIFERHFSTQCSVANESVVIIEESPSIVVDLKSPTSDLNAMQIQLNVSRGRIEPLPVEFTSHVMLNYLIRGKYVSEIKNLAYAPIAAVFTHLIPWQINVWYSTINFNCQNENLEYKLKLQPRIMRKSPTLIEMSFTIPAQSTCQVSYKFQKSFLHFTEYPPDAHHGIHAPGPVLTLIPSTDSQLHGGKVRIYGGASAMNLPTPDFSMPFNVICFVCTIAALIFQRFLSFTTQYISIVDKPPKEGLIRRLIAKVVMGVRRKKKAD